MIPDARTEAAGLNVILESAPLLRGAPVGIIRCIHVVSTWRQRWEGHVKKWGNSAAVRIPAAVLADAGIELDQPVEVREERGAS